MIIQIPWELPQAKYKMSVLSKHCHSFAILHKHAPSHCRQPKIRKVSFEAEGWNLFTFERFTMRSAVSILERANFRTQKLCTLCFITVTIFCHASSDNAVPSLLAGKTGNFELRFPWKSKLKSVATGPSCTTLGVGLRGPD